MPNGELIRTNEDGPYDWELIDQLERLEKWGSEIHERCEDSARKDDDPLLLRWYVRTLFQMIRAQVQITIEQDLEFFTKLERKRTLQEWLIAVPSSLEYKKAQLYLPEQTIEIAQEDISRFRASIDARAKEIAAAISAVFGYTEHFEFWPVLITGAKTPYRKPALGAASKQKLGQSAGAKTSHGRFQDWIEACICRLRSQGREINYQTVALMMVINLPKDIQVLPRDYRQRIKKTRFAGNLLEFIEDAEKAKDPINFRKRFENMFSLVNCRCKESNSTP